MTTLETRVSDAVQSFPTPTLSQNPYYGLTHKDKRDGYGLQRAFLIASDFYYKELLAVG